MLWQSVLNAPCFIINLDRRPDRWISAFNRCVEAGYQNIIRIKAVDGRSEEELREGWQAHGSPKFNPRDQEFIHTLKGKQGCALSMLNVWKHIIDKEIPIATVFEDDVEFHKDWARLAPDYWNQTPKVPSCVVFMGHQPEYPPRMPVDSVPVFCLNACVISLEGAQFMYDLCLNAPGGMWTIDCIIKEYMESVFYGRTKMPEKFRWYVWTCMNKEDIDSAAHKVAEEAKKNMGLVFQDAFLDTDIRKPYGLM